MTRNNAFRNNLDYMGTRWGGYAPFDAMPQMLAESHNVDEDTHFAKRRVVTKEWTVVESSKREVDLTSAAGVCRKRTQ